MRLEKELPEDAEMPGVPEVLRTNLVRKLKGPCKRVKVEAETDKRTWISLNAIKLAERGAVSQNPDVDAVAELLVRIIHAYHIEHSADANYTHRYRVTIELRNDQGRTPISERPFRFRYAPEEPDDFFESDTVRENAVLEDALAMQRSAYDQMAAQNQELHETVIEFARMMVEPIRASVDMQSSATMQWINGANMLVQGYSQQYQTQSLVIQEEAKSKRVAQILDKLGQPIAELSMGLLGGLMNKFGGKGNAPPAQRKREAAPARAEQAADEGEGEGEAAGEGEAEGEVDSDKVLAVVCEAFAMTITPAQRRSMSANMTLEQIAALDAVFAANSNDEVVVGWRRAEPIVGSKLLWLAGIMTPEQLSDFAKIRAMISRHAEKLDLEAKSKAQPDDGDGSDKPTRRKRRE